MTPTYPLSLTIPLQSLTIVQKLLHNRGCDLEAEMLAAAAEEFLKLDSRLDKAYVRGIVVGTIKRAQKDDPNVTDVRVTINSLVDPYAELPKEFLVGYISGLNSYES